MTSQAQRRDSPYLVAFMLAAMMVWSFSSITRSMDVALQQTHVQLRAPIGDLGTAIQDSAIALRHRLKPQTPAAQPSPQESQRLTPRAAAPLPLIQQALTPVTIPEVSSLTDLIAPSTPSKGNGKGSSGKIKQVRTLHSSVALADVLGPPSPVTDPGPGRGRAPAHAGR